jgi:hypothetical protein
LKLHVKMVRFQGASAAASRCKQDIDRTGEPKRGGVAVGHRPPSRFRTVLSCHSSYASSHRAPPARPLAHRGIPAGWAVLDASRRSLAYVYGSDERAGVADDRLTLDEARGSRRTSRGCRNCWRLDRGEAAAPGCSPPRAARMPEVLRASAIAPPSQSGGCRSRVATPACPVPVTSRHACGVGSARLGAPHTAATPSDAQVSCRYRVAAQAVHDALQGRRRGSRG